MAEIRSKNVYELLGNDPELDPNRAPEPPTKALDKPAPRVGKREAPKEAPSQPPSQPRENTGRRGQRSQGNEAAYRDRNAGRRNNVDRPVDEGKNPERRGFNARDDRGGRSRNDRQNRSGVTDSRKQINQGWGGQSGEREFDDEKAGQNIAQTDENEPQTPATAEEEAADKAKSFADYLAEKAAQGDLSAKPVRAPNEGTKVDGKWAQAKEFKRGEDDEEYIKGKEEKSKAPKQRKEKNYLDVDMRFVESSRPSGGSGPRGRGGRGGRGSGRGGRGGNGPRAERGAGPTPVTVDEKNFPTLGS